MSSEPPIKVTVIIPKMDPRLVAELRDASPRLEVRYAEQRDDLTHALSDTEVLIGLRLPFDLASAPKLRWIQLYSAGVDYLLDHALMRSAITLTTTRGIHAIPGAEYIFTSMLAFTHKFPQMYQAQLQHKWVLTRREDVFGGEVYGSTLGVLGLGKIGTAVAHLAQCFGLRVIASRRSDEPEPGSPVDRYYPPNELHAMLAECDFLAVCVPLTPETTHLIGEAELRAMKPTAYLVNVARGAVIDQTALVRALREGWIAGAGLDVFEQEPLPADSELYDLPNVILTPHVAGLSTRSLERFTGVARENLRRYAEGRPLVNVVDKHRAY